MLRVGFGLFAALLISAGPQGKGERGYVAGNFFLNLGNEKCGFVKSVDGGAISAEVIVEKTGADNTTKKHIGAPKYEEFVLQIPFHMSKGIYDWIAVSWKGNPPRKDGSITACDYKMEARSSREFFHALITEVTVPECNGASKEPEYLTVKFAPETIRSVKASGKMEAGESGKEHAWVPSNFRLEIDGLDCTKVMKIDSFTVKQKVVADNVGNARDAQKEAGKLEFPNLRISLAENGSQSWADWFEDFVIKGNNSQEKEKSGTLVFLSPNREKELARIKFVNLGIFKMGAEKAEANSENIKHVYVELYCERMEFEHAAGK